MRHVRKSCAGFVAALACLFAVGFGSTARADVTHQFSFGAGMLSQPTSVAVDEATGDVYVADYGNDRIVRFDEDGAFIETWGRGVNASTGAGICTAASGDTCVKGVPGGEAGWFDGPTGIAIDNSAGPAAGSVYVQDAGNNRIQRFSPDGEFVLTWGLVVDQQNGNNLCTAVSGHTCQAGTVSGHRADPDGVPPVTEVPSADGVFAGWPEESGSPPRQELAVDGQGSVYVGDPYAAPYARVQKFTAGGQFVSKLVTDPTVSREAIGLSNPALNSEGRLYISYNSFPKAVWAYDQADFGADAAARKVFGATLEAGTGLAVDPTNQFIFTFAARCLGKPGTNGAHLVEFHPSGQEVDCSVLPQGGSFTVSRDHRLYLGAGNEIRVYGTPIASTPDVTGQSAAEITAHGARIGAQITANFDDTTFHVEYGTAPCSSNPCESTSESESIGAASYPEPATRQIAGLEEATTYYYRVVASNGEGSEPGSDRSFTTYPTPEFDPSCGNNLARQQTGAAFLLDCRAYELVSAAEQGGYDVESDLVDGQTPLAGFPGASGKALYAVHNGGIPGVGLPTNRGPDPYVATRRPDQGRWETAYVGVPANAPSNEPFSSPVSGADAGLSTFAFGGPEFCNPCFGDATSGIPLRRPDGLLTQGMKGSLAVADPQPAGDVRKPVSADGTHLVFGSYQQFTADGNDSGADLTIYDRNLVSGTTQVVSKTPAATTFEAADRLAQLDMSSDGARILFGERVSTDAAGNPLWHLYMHVGRAITSIDLTPGVVEGVRFAGMNGAGTRVYFATADQLTTEADQDSDESIDVYRADVSPTASVLTRVSVGTGAGNTDLCDPAANSVRERWNTFDGSVNCDAVPVGGAGGVSSGNGTVYFLSPESLDGQGEADAPNLYAARPGSSPELVATLESSASSPLEPERHVLERSYGSFSYPEGVAIDRQSGSTYVLDTIAGSGPLNEETFQPDFTPGAYVQKFDAAGQPDLTFADNSKLKTSPVSGPFLHSGAGGFFSAPVGVSTQIAVDNSPEPSKGTLYVPDYGNFRIFKYGPSGNYLGSLKLGEFGDLPTGVAVNPANGNVYATAEFASAVFKFTSEGSPVGKPNSFPVEGPPLGVAVDAAGRAYVVNGRNTKIYSSTGALLKLLDDDPSYGVAVDPATGYVYVDKGHHVAIYDSSWEPLDEKVGVGLLGDSVSLAADSRRLVVSNPERGRVASYSLRTPPSGAYDNPLVIHSVGSPDSRRTADFQSTPDGSHSTFASARPLTGVETANRYQVFRSAPGGVIECASCSTTGADPASDASLAVNGLSITDDGRVFFTTGDPLVLRDANSRKDAYEWKEGKVELISTGQSNFDSSLFSVTANGVDAFFFTHQTLDPGDRNGDLVKLYDARAAGGFFKIAEPPACAAPDECRGAGSEEAPLPRIGTVTGSGGNQPTEKTSKRCRKPRVKRGGRCVKPKAKGRKRAKRGHLG